MVRIFTGKITYQHYAKNDLAVLVIPRTLDVGQPILVYWQWSVDAKGLEKQNASAETIITKSDLVQTEGTTKKVIQFASYYDFKLEIAVDDKGDDTGAHELTFG